MKELRTFKTTVKPEQVSRLLREFEKLKFDLLNDQYVDDPEECKETWFHDSTTTLSIQKGGKLKTIQHYHGCQGTAVTRELTVLATKIDEVLGTPAWVGQRTEIQARPSAPGILKRATQ